MASIPAPARKQLTPFPRVPTPHWRGIGPQHTVQLRKAAQNLANAAESVHKPGDNIVTVVICGDSTSLETGNDSLNILETIHGQIRAKLIRENPGVPFRFIDRGIGGNTWGNLAGVGGGTLPSWYSTPAAQWISSYIAGAGNGNANKAPDLVVICMGTNDNDNMGMVSPSSVLAKFGDTAANLFPTIPDVWLVTSTGRSQQPGVSTAAQRYGSVLAGSTVRQIARGGHALLTQATTTYPRAIGLLDAGRLWAMTTLGYDPADQAFQRMLPAELTAYQGMSTTGTAGWTLPYCDGDFDYTIVFPGQGSTFLVGRNLRITMGAPLTSGSVNSQFVGVASTTNMATTYQPGLGTVQYAGTNRAMGTGDVTLRVMARQERAVLQLNGLTVWDAPVVRGHARFQPRLFFNTNGAADLTANLTEFRAGKGLTYAATMDDAVAWGTSSVGINGSTGGNTINHPSSIYYQEVIGRLLAAEDFNLSLPLAA